MDQHIYVRCKEPNSLSAGLTLESREQNAEELLTLTSFCLPYPRHSLNCLRAIFVYAMRVILC